MNPENVLSAMMQGTNLDYISFKLAIVFAERGSNVWFISQEPFTQVAKNIEQPEKDILQKIIFIYLKDFDEILKHLNSTHTWRKVPSLIILKDFDLYCELFKSDYNASKTALLSATLLDSAACCSRKNDSKSFVLVSFSKCEEQRYLSERLQVLLDMYFEKYFLKKSDNDENLLKDITSYFS